MTHAAIIVLLAATSLGWGCNHAAQPEAVAAEAAKEVAVPITAVRVAVQPSERVVNFVGTLYGNEEVTLSSQIEGQIESLQVDLGDSVSAGQVLARIEDDQWLARLRESEATLAKARADEERGRALVGRNVISPQEYESMKTLAAVAQAQRDTLLVTIRHAQVESPISGAVAKRFVSAGEYVRAGSQLFSLVDDDPLKLRGDVPERFAHELQPEQMVRVRIDAFPTETFAGRLTRISPASNPQNRSVSVEAVVDNQARQLKPGFFANAAVVTRSDDRALMVPQDALVTFAGVTKLFVVHDGKAFAREVHTGTRGGGGLIEITDGISADDLVATSGIAKLEDGVAVTVKDTAALPAAPTS